MSGRWTFDFYRPTVVRGAAVCTLHQVVPDGLPHHGVELGVEVVAVRGEELLVGPALRRGRVEAGQGGQNLHPELISSAHKLNKLNQIIA